MRKTGKTIYLRNQGRVNVSMSRPNTMKPEGIDLGINGARKSKIFFRFGDDLPNPCSDILVICGCSTRVSNQSLDFKVSRIFR